MWPPSNGSNGSMLNIPTNTFTYASNLRTPARPSLRPTEPPTWLMPTTVVGRFSTGASLFVICSKTFATVETLTARLLIAEIATWFALLTWFAFLTFLTFLTRFAFGAHFTRLFVGGSFQNGDFTRAQNRGDAHRTDRKPAGAASMHHGCRADRWRGRPDATSPARAREDELIQGRLHDQGVVCLFAPDTKTEQ